jgi:hypothetical protein
VTGPHLHWNARYGTHTVDPLDLIALEQGWYQRASAPTGARPEGSKY